MGRRRGILSGKGAGERRQERRPHYATLPRRAGDAIGPIVRVHPDEFGPFPPYRLDNNALFIAFNNAAEFGVHIQRKWGQPACAIDAYVEFRHYTNDGRIKSGDREKGFYGLDGALRFFCENGIDTAHKKEMRGRILQGPPFSADEEDAIVTYCEDDVRALARVVQHLVPTIRSLPHAMARANFQWCSALHEQRVFRLTCRCSNGFAPTGTGCRSILFANETRLAFTRSSMTSRTGASSVSLASYSAMGGPGRSMPTGRSINRPDLQMTGRYPQVETLRELRYSMSKLRLNDLAVGNDGRARTPLWAYGTKTARNAPSNSQYIFGPAKWIWFLITPPPGRVLVHRDYKQQEVRIAAILSGDLALLQACESGDVYLGIAQQLGFVRESMNAAELKAVRVLFKTVVLGIQYGLGALSLSISDRHLANRGLRNLGSVESSVPGIRNVGRGRD